MATDQEDNGDRSPGRARAEGPLSRAGVEGPIAPAGLGGDSGVGATRVAEVRQALAEGTYRVDHRRVAERIVQVEDLTRA